MALATHSGELGSMPGRTAESGHAVVLFFAGVMVGVSFACAAERWNSSCALERRISCRSDGPDAFCGEGLEVLSGEIPTDDSSSAFSASVM